MRRIVDIEEVITDYVDEFLNAVAIDVYFKDEDEGMNVAYFCLDTGKVFWKDYLYTGVPIIQDAINLLYPLIKYQIGDRVRVVKYSDDTFNKDFMYKEGVTKRFNTNGYTGNTRKDPMITISVKGMDDESFWREELIRIPGGKDGE